MRVDLLSILFILKDEYVKGIIFLLFVYFNVVALFFRLTYSNLHEFWSCKEVSCLHNVFNEMLNQDSQKTTSQILKHSLKNPIATQRTGKCYWSAVCTFTCVCVCVCVCVCGACVGRSDVSKRSIISTKKNCCHQQLYVGRCYFCVRSKPSQNKIRSDSVSLVVFWKHCSF